MCHIWHSNRKEVRKFMMKRTISGMIGAGSLAHNRRDFVAENVDPKKTQYNICYRNENLQEVYKELFDEAVERYNVGKRNDRKITNYYEKIRLGKQEKLFHEVIFQILILITNVQLYSVRIYIFCYKIPRSEEHTSELQSH